jgi:hypothetical protein
VLLNCLYFGLHAKLPYNDDEFEANVPE